MRSYGQYCALARTLDIVGDRWTLLLVRELATRPCRYTDLRAGLPGIATNLLAERLRELQAAGVVAAEQAPSPVGTTLYSLTEWGEGLRPILIALGRWGSARVMPEGRRGDHFRSHWTGIGTEAAYAGVDLSGLEPLTILVDAGGDPVLLAAGPGGFTSRTATAATRADITLDAEPDVVVALLVGRLHPDDLDPGLRAALRAEPDALRRFVALTDRARAARGVTAAS